METLWVCGLVEEAETLLPAVFSYPNELARPCPLEGALRVHSSQRSDPLLLLDWCGRQ